MDDIEVLRRGMSILLKVPRTGAVLVSDFSRVSGIYEGEGQDGVQKMGTNTESACCVLVYRL